MSMSDVTRATLAPLPTVARRAADPEEPGAFCAGLEEHAVRAPAHPPTQRVLVHAYPTPCSRAREIVVATPVFKSRSKSHDWLVQLLEGEGWTEEQIALKVRAAKRQTQHALARARRGRVVPLRVADPRFYHKVHEQRVAEDNRVFARVHSHENEPCPCRLLYTSRLREDAAPQEYSLPPPFQSCGFQQLGRDGEEPLPSECHVRWHAVDRWVASLTGLHQLVPTRPADAPDGAFIPGAWYCARRTPTSDEYVIAQVSYIEGDNRKEKRVSIRVLREKVHSACRSARAASDGAGASPPALALISGSFEKRARAKKGQCKCCGSAAPHDSLTVGNTTVCAWSRVKRGHVELS
jgi:hypothetical protein